MIGLLAPALMVWSLLIPVAPVSAAVLAEEKESNNYDSENNREATMAVVGFIAGVAFAFGATADADRLA